MPLFRRMRVTQIDSQSSSLTRRKVRFLGPRRVFEISALQTAVSMATRCTMWIRFMHLLEFRRERDSSSVEFSNWLSASTNNRGRRFDEKIQQLKRNFWAQRSYVVLIVTPLVMICVWIGRSISIISCFSHFSEKI
jgi:hypothetical protein